MLTGDHEITSGEAWVKGFSVKNDMKTAYKYIGTIFPIHFFHVTERYMDLYCPESVYRASVCGEKNEWRDIEFPG